MMKIMTVNDNRTLYKLTTGEIYVLAGLLGYNTVWKAIRLTAGEMI